MMPPKFKVGDRVLYLGMHPGIIRAPMNGNCWYFEFLDGTKIEGLPSGWGCAFEAALELMKPAEPQLTRYEAFATELDP